jgi:hypothetical protein
MSRKYYWEGQLKTEEEMYQISFENLVAKCTVAKMENSLRLVKMIAKEDYSEDRKDVKLILDVIAALKAKSDYVKEQQK